MTPKASRERVEGLQADADGAFWLKAAVTAAPESGKANAAVLKLLAREWGVAKSTLSVVSGATDRRKTVLVEGDAALLLAALEIWLKGRSDG